MLSKPEREQIIALIKREVVPAIGCTEPIAVALCVAKAREILGTEPEKVSARLSANILKNAMGVGIPGTGMIGLPIAIALGALVGRSEYQLEVLKDSDAKAVERGKRFIEQGRIDISLKEAITEKLYIEIKFRAADTPLWRSSPAGIRISSSFHGTAKRFRRVVVPPAANRRRRASNSTCAKCLTSP